MAIVSGCGGWGPINPSPGIPILSLDISLVFRLGDPRMRIALDAMGAIMPPDRSSPAPLKPSTISRA